MRWRRLAMTILLAFVVAINASSLGWAIASNDTQSIISSVFGIIFSVYVLVLACRSVNEQEVYLHTKAVIQITTLSTIATSLFFAAAILPDTPPVTTDISQELESTPVGLWYAILALYSVVFAISITTPLGPKLHFPPERIYSEKTVMAITNKDEENVCGAVGTISHTFCSYFTY